LHGLFENSLSWLRATELLKGPMILKSLIPLIHLLENKEAQKNRVVRVQPALVSQIAGIGDKRLTWTGQRTPFSQRHGGI
jgi:hypothetical protein